jgi:hypothetical protein
MLRALAARSIAASVSLTDNFRYVHIEIDTFQTVSCINFPIVICRGASLCALLNSGLQSVSSPVAVQPGLFYVASVALAFWETPWALQLLD